MGKEKSRVRGKGRGQERSVDEQDPLDGLLIEDEEGPTRSLGSIEDALGHSADPVKPGIGSFVASDEAMRVFDEMSNPGGEYSMAGGYSVRFRGQAEDASMVETLAPYTDGKQPAGEPLDGDLSPELGEAAPLPTALRLPAGIGASPRTTFRDGWEVFEHCPCPLFRLDGLGRIVVANRSLCEFLGSAPEELQGKALHDTRLGRLYAALEKDVEVCLSGGASLQRFLSFQDADGRTVRFLLWIVPLTEGTGRPMPFAGIILPFPGE